jgi:hypothetical protein
MIGFQEMLLFIMGYESHAEYEFYRVQSTFYIILRYILVVAIYLLFFKDYKSIG